MSNQSPFRPAWWLPGPHLPTVYGKLVRRIPPAQDRIEQWTTPDGDSVSVARVEASRPDAPILTIFHGLEGTVRSNYAQGLMHEARARGWGAAMLIWRSCDGRDRMELREQQMTLDWVMALPKETNTAEAKLRIVMTMDTRFTKVDEPVTIEAPTE